MLPERFQSPKILKYILTANLIGTLIGFGYYWEQLVSAPTYLWIFIPASPLATAFIALSLYLQLKGRPSGLINSLAFIGNFKYGIWTLFVVLYYPENFIVGQVPLFIIISLSHIFMALQPFLFLKWRYIKIKHLSLAYLWFLLNDIIDYTLGTHTELYTPYTVPAELVAYLLTYLSLLSGLYLVLKKES